jgi:dTDP-4-dehydrorhamnose reductase
MQYCKVLLLGANGMLGSGLKCYLSVQKGIKVFGTVRTAEMSQCLPPERCVQIIGAVDVCDDMRLCEVFTEVRPDVVVNCIGVVKQLADAEDPHTAISINSLLPHRLAHFCEATGARLIHFSTDCVFSGVRGRYVESDVPDAADMYGRSKLLGEVDYPNALTLRTSLIGHELNSSRSLVDWFLSQGGSVKGYQRAIFSGLPTVEIARVIHEYVLPNPALRGVYHLSVDPISKFDLLSLVAKVYKKNIEIIPDDSVVIDRSLDSTRFRETTGFKPKPWPQLIQEMHDFR